ncbi:MULTISPECIES: YhgE/Pip family protein [Lactobacillaceae]|mgnify:CR=1 FL=1|nr:YhgE/Pip domain-containing protein [Lentilactobacillus hilgardii]
MLKEEWKFLNKKKMLIIVLVAIALIPSIYCYLYLSSMWNTYGKMDHIPVAIVNYDKKVHYHGKTINIGSNLVKKLKKSDSLNFHQVSSQLANRRLKNGHYYMTLTIPKNTSHNATTILSKSPHRLNLHFKINSGQNFIVSKMTTGAISAIKQKVSNQIIKLYVRVTLNTLSNARNGMYRASIGNSQLVAGDKKLYVGTRQLNSGMLSLAMGTKRLMSGTQNLANGTEKVKAGFAKLTSNDEILNTGLNQLVTGLNAMNKSNPALQKKNSALSNLALNIKRQLSTGRTSNTQLLSEINTLKSELSSVDTGNIRTDIGNSKLLSGVISLQSGFKSYTNGVNGLSTANVGISNGLGNLESNIPTLASGASKLAAGTETLLPAILKINAGNKKISQSLLTGVKKLRSIYTHSNNVRALASPINGHITDIAKVPNNGTGMAPFAIAIGLYVGAIALGTMYEAYIPRKHPTSAWSWWSSKASVIGSVALLQSILLYWTLISGNRLNTNSDIMLLLAILMGSVLFLSLIFFLRIWLGGFGTWLVSIVLVLQLSSSGGLYPIQLVSSFAKAVNPWLPMTYLINMLRSVISTNTSTTIDIITMILIIILLNTLIIIRFKLDIVRRIFAYEDPVLEN